MAFTGPIWDIIFAQKRMGAESAYEGLWYMMNHEKKGMHWWAGQPDGHFPWTFPDYRAPEPEFGSSGVGM